jgi:uncharacterized protein YhdP
MPSPDIPLVRTLIGPLRELPARLGRLRGRPAARQALWRRARLAALGLVFCLALALTAAAGYTLAKERIPEHRAMLTRLVRSYTGLPVRFRELGLRWGWYGPEAVFRQVELGELAGVRPVLAAPELIVSFDLWSTVRSGDLTAARITLMSPDIDLTGDTQAPAARPRPATGPRGRRAAPAAPAASGRLALLSSWQGGRVDVEGGSLRLADPAGGEALSLPIGSASLRRAGLHWSATGLFFLPERLGRSARLSLKLTGDPAHAASLGGQLRFSGSRLRLAGWRQILAGLPAMQRCLPVAGAGDIELSAGFAHGQLTASAGRARLVGLTVLAPADGAPLELPLLAGRWQLTRQAEGLRLTVSGLTLDTASSAPALLTLTAGPDARRLTGHLMSAPLGPVLELARALAPQWRLPGVELAGAVRELSFDWDESRPAGQRLATAATLTDVSLAPSSHAFLLGGLALTVAGSEGELAVRGESPQGSLVLAQAVGQPLTGLAVSQELRVRRNGTRWEVSVPRLTLVHEGTELSLHGSLHSGLAGKPAQIALQGELTGADLPLLLALSRDSTAAFGAIASHLTAGRIEAAQLSLSGPLDERLLQAGNGFTGSLTVRDSMLSGGDLWPDANGVSARIDWRGADIHAQLLSASAGPFHVESGQAQWNALGRGPTHVTGRVRGRLEEVIGWLRSHPALAAHAPQIAELDLAGGARLDLDVRVPPPGPTAPAAVTAQVAAVLDGGQLSPMAGLPPVRELTGTLRLADGLLARSTLTGRWLGGPVTLRLAESRSHGVPVLTVAGHGTLDARQITLGNVPRDSQGLTGNSDWSGELAFVAGGRRAPQWRARAEASLAGVASALPEPLAKPAGLPLPLRVSAQGGPGQALLRASLGERLRSVLALRELPGSASGWVIERGDVRLGAGVVSLPRERVLRVTGRAPRIELPPYLALWQQLRRSPDAPAVRAQLALGELTIVGQRFAQVRLALERRSRTDTLTVESSGLAGAADWPLPEDGLPASLRFARLTLPDVAAPGAAAVVLAALGSAAHVTVDDLIWSGHSLGTLTGSLTFRSPVQGGAGASLDIEDLTLAGSLQQAQGSLRCGGAQCRVTGALITRDAAASLRDFGFRPELSAAHGTITAELSWPMDAPAPLAGALEGHVSLTLEDGATGLPEGASRDGAPFPLLSVPALVAGAAPGEQASPVPLRFVRLAGDFEVHEGQARTANLHFDGDAEILVRGRLGLLSRDYDQQAWILRGGERLPAALRRLGPTQGVAAVWLGLRDLFSAGPRRSRAALHLQGSWDDPIVSSE